MDDAMMAMTRGIDPDIVEALVDYGRELKIADLTDDAAKWQRLYLEVCQELAQTRADLGDAQKLVKELLVLSLVAVYGANDKSLTLPYWLRPLDQFTARTFEDSIWNPASGEAVRRLDALAATVPQGGEVMGYMDEIVKSVDEYREDIVKLEAELAATKAELGQWREMAAIIKENVSQFEIRISEGLLDKAKSWVDFVEYETGDVWTGEGDDLPEAVKAAYEEVVKDE